MDLTKKQAQENTRMPQAAKLLIVLSLAVFIIGAFFIFVPSKTAQEPLKIGIVVYPGYAPLFVAKEKGFFEKEGVNAEIVVINDFNQLISSIASGNVQMLISTADYTPVVRHAGVDVKEILVADIGYGADGLVVKNDIATIADLKGRQVYLSIGSPSHFLFRYMAEQEGLSAGDIELIQMEPDQVGAAFAAGQIDYGMTWEPWLSKASEREDGKVLITSKAKPGIITDTFVVRADALQARKEDVRAVVRAWFDAVEFLDTNPDEANAIMSKGFGLPAEEFSLQIKTVKFLNYSENLAKFDKSTPLNLYDLTEKAVDIFSKDGILKSPVDPEEIIDPTLLEGLYR